MDRTTTQVEVYIGHVTSMFLKPCYRNGLHVRHGLADKDAAYTWMLEPDGGRFVVSGQWSVGLA